MTDEAPAPRSPLRLVLAAALIVAGGGWMLQGLGILTAVRSFMVGDPTWVVIGAVVLVIGVVIAVRGRR
jgi:hypothetical protein